MHAGLLKVVLRLVHTSRVSVGVAGSRPRSGTPVQNGEGNPENPAHTSRIKRRGSSMTKAMTKVHWQSSL